VRKKTRKRLAADISDIMLSGDAVPMVQEGASFQEALQIMDAGGLGTTLVVSREGALVGIITDGDIRRLVVKQVDFARLSVDGVMIRNPKHICQDKPALDALNIMEKHQITVLPVISQGNQIRGILHLHTILGKGEFIINGA
jgi:arabinose-5-phosphate isomerase